MRLPSPKAQLLFGASGVARQLSCRATVVSEFLRSAVDSLQLLLRISLFTFSGLAGHAFCKDLPLRRLGSPL